MTNRPAAQIITTRPRRATVRCPYCRDNHTHGYDGTDDGVRVALCHRGEYVICGPGVVAYGVECPACHAPPGTRCKTRLLRGYHLARADKAVRQSR